MKNKHITIGILGGIGPEATGSFYLKLIKEIQKQKLVKSNTDYPRMIINSIPAPELTNGKITTAELRPYIKGLQELENYGVDFIVMACNTIHLYHDLLQRKIGVPILNLRDAVEETIKGNKAGIVSIFGTPATVKNGLYQFESVKYLNPAGKDLKRLSIAIENFNKGKQRGRQISNVNKLVSKYAKRGSGIIILGCTEISLMLKESKVSRIDTLDILALATIKKFQEMKKRLDVIAPLQEPHRDL